jgi:phospholipid/cholesterol/gamma-HCH transport system permease protein
MELLEQLGGFVIRSIEEVGQFTMLTGQAVAGTVQRPFRLRLLFKQMEFVGVRSLSIVLITGTFTGMVFALQSGYAFGLFGAEGLVGSTVGLALSRELSPTLCGLMVTARAGSAMAAELGTMRVTEQIDALESMAVDPVKYLVVPRLIATTVMMPALTMVFTTVGMVGCFFVSISVLGIDEGAFLQNFDWFVDPDDFTNGLIKSAFFGFIIATVGSVKGYYTTGGAEGVGRSTTRAVVIASVSILISNYFLTQWLQLGD